MKRLIYPLLFLFFLGLLGFGWYKEGLLPTDKSDNKPIIFVIEPGSSVSSISRNLENQKLIRNRLVFYLEVKLKGLEKKIQYGDFRLSRQMSASEIAKELTHGTLDVWVTIIEGMRTEEVANVLAKKLDLPESVFIENAKSKEGYLFPDTYLMPKNTTVQYALTILQNNFDNKINSSIKQRIAKTGLSFHEALTLASLLEREAQSFNDKQIIAGILFNRLELDMPLQVDATVQYALGYSNKEHSWWRKNITLNDLKIDSYYNTYLYSGLPPGPIANPGLESILAVAESKSTDYLYYITDDSGQMHYAKTLDGHNKNITLYLD